MKHGVTGPWLTKMILKSMAIGLLRAIVSWGVAGLLVGLLCNFLFTLFSKPTHPLQGYIIGAIFMGLGIFLYNVIPVLIGLIGQFRQLSAIDRAKIVLGNFEKTHVTKEPA